MNFLLVYESVDDRVEFQKIDGKQNSVTVWLTESSLSLYQLL